MMTEKEAREIAAEAVKDSIGDWNLKHQPGWMSECAEVKFISCDAVQVDEGTAYVLKGYARVEQERSIMYLRGGGDLALVLVLVRLDAETGKVLNVDHRERKWEEPYSPSVEEFDIDWANGVKQGEWVPWM